MPRSFNRSGCFAVPLRTGDVSPVLKYRWVWGRAEGLGYWKGASKPKRHCFPQLGIWKYPAHGSPRQVVPASISNPAHIRAGYAVSTLKNWPTVDKTCQQCVLVNWCCKQFNWAFSPRRENVIELRSRSEGLYWLGLSCTVASLNTISSCLHWQPGHCNTGPSSSAANAHSWEAVRLPAESRSEIWAPSFSTAIPLFT